MAEGIRIGPRQWEVALNTAVPGTSSPTLLFLLFVTKFSAVKSPQPLRNGLLCHCRGLFSNSAFV